MKTFSKSDNVYVTIYIHFVFGHGGYVKGPFIFEMSGRFWQWILMDVLFWYLCRQTARARCSIV